MFKWFKRKAMTSAQLAQLFGLGKASWMNRNYFCFADEAYSKNVIAFHCISKISQAVADIPYFLKINDEEVEKHPIITLLKRPNPQQSYKTWMRQLVMYRLISGNSYIYGNTASTKRVMELTNLRPDRVYIRTNSYNEPIAFDYTINGKLFTYPIDPITYESEILQIKEPNPLCDLYGLSPISAAAMSIDQHNESSEWNKKLLENGARPPGVLVMKDRTDNAPSLSAEQLRNIKEEINEKYAGARNAGKIPVMNFDMEWRAMGMSPADMDWLNGRSTSARDICLAFGYPALLLGMPEGSTFNNVSEAKLALYEETVVPLLQNILCELSYFLTNQSGGKQEIDIVADLDQVSALAPRRESLRKNAIDAVNAGLITPNEGRNEINYDPLPNADDLLVPAGKLPISFDPTNMNKSHFEMWLKAEGFNDSHIKEMSRLAYETRQ